MFLNTLAQFLYLSFLLIIPLRAIVVNKNEFSIDGSDIGLTSTLQAQIPHLTNSKGKILGNATMISINDLAMGDVSHALFLCQYCVRKLHSKDVNEKITSNLKIIPYFHD